MKRNFNFAVGNRFTDGLIIIISVVLLMVFPREPKPPKISIHQAAKDGNIEAVKLDLADGMDVNAKDDRRRTSLHYAAEEDYKEIAELLIAAGVNVNAKNNLGGTPLHE
ncbi:MAG: ankyrin repeat domain-containing protein, partial [Nitrospinaceae bacterium]|nr:ankyrin repeat domain-containing protein [Nitrospinaceae bacterium]